jgi:DNA-binding CsgD family transcriptional regulator/PAS domain-containing protein
MSVDARVLDVVELLYEAAMDESRWPDTLKQLSELTESQAGTLWVLDRSDQPRYPTFTFVNLDPAFIQEYLDYMAPLDPTAQYVVRHPHQSVIHDGLVITERDKSRSAYYDWHLRYGDLRFRMVGQVSPAPAVQAGVSMLRTSKSGRFEPADIERFAFLQRHIHRALALGFRLGSLGTLQQCTTELLDRNPAAILLLDDQKRIVYANRRAEALHTARDGMSLSGGLQLASNQDNDKLQTLIVQTIADSSLATAGGGMQASRPSGRRPYVILVYPMSARYETLMALRPAVCVVVIDPEVTASVPLERLQAVLGLTEAEARLAALLAEGQDLRDAALQLGITYGTARTRLATIFQKTDTRRQGELIKLLLTTIAVP